MRRAILESALLLALSLLLGLGTAGFRSPRVPMKLPAEFFVPESGARPILLAQGRDYLERGGVVFVDARPEEVFTLGHIPSALNIPADRYMELAAEAAGWLEGVPLVLYGSTGNVNEADNLAARLQEYGYGPVFILAEGYESWAEAGFPVEAGRAGILETDAWNEEEAWDDETPDGEEAWDDEAPDGEEAWDDEPPDDGEASDEDSWGESGARESRPCGQDPADPQDPDQAS